MKICFWLAILLVTTALQAAEFVDDQILVHLQPGVTIATINTRYNTTTVEEEVSGITYKVMVADPSLLPSTLNAMKNDVDLLWADNDYFGDSPESLRRTLAVVDTTPTTAEYTDQEALARIHAPEAHNFSKGAGVLVAVIDTGVDYNHPDLTNHVLRDSGNQVVGIDFVDNDSDPMDSTNGVDDDGDGDTDEGAGHGTHVAGIIALVAPDAKIVPIRVLDDEGTGNSDNVAAAIRWFADPAFMPGSRKVINLSLGIAGIDRVEIIHDAIDDFIGNRGLKIPVVASAGNDDLDEAHYPASEGDVLSIAATDPNDVKADFSNYKRVDVAAPGVGIYSTFLSNGYATWSGTSMAAPFVSGEVALVKAIEGPNELTNEQMENRIKDTADNIDAQNPGIDLGSGRINLLAAVSKSTGLHVKKAIFKTQKQLLWIKIVSDFGAADSLSVEGYGPMVHKSGKRFSLKLKGATPPPPTVNITSTAFAVTISVPILFK